jgi:hypothetical protein
VKRGWRGGGGGGNVLDYGTVPQSEKPVGRRLQVKPCIYIYIYIYIFIKIIN